MQMKQMKLYLFLFLMPLLPIGSAAGEVVYRCNFSPEELKGWRLGKIAISEKTPDGYVLKITAAADKAHIRSRCRSISRRGAGKYCV